MNAFRAAADGRTVAVEVRADALVVDGEPLPWVDLDLVDVDGVRVHLVTVDGRSCTLSHLATAFDRFVSVLTEARARARRAALLQWTGDAPVASFDAKRGAERVQVHLFPDGLTVEPLTGAPDMLPLSCLVAVERDGYELVLRARGLPDVHVRHAGNRTDELLQRLDAARRAQAVRTADTYAALSPALAGLAAADGWAVDATAAGACWPVLVATVRGHRRAAEVDLLASLAGDRLRLGLKCGPGDAVLPFALAPVGDRVAVEATDAEDRATFVFHAPDVDRLNAALLATSFRREALSLPVDRLGRWGLAVRTLDVVRWARGALVARVVHDDRWEAGIARALGG